MKLKSLSLLLLLLLPSSSLEKYHNLTCALLERALCFCVCFSKAVAAGVVILIVIVKVVVLCVAISRFSKGTPFFAFATGRV